MTADARAPAALRELIEAVGAEPLQPLLAELGRELEGFAAAPPGDVGALAAQAHGLVGAAGGIGFLDLAERCRAVETACKAGADPAPALREALAASRVARAVIAALGARATR